MKTIFSPFIGKPKKAVSFLLFVLIATWIIVSFIPEQYAFLVVALTGATFAFLTAEYYLTD